MKCNSLFDQVRQEAFRLGLSDLGIVAVSDSVSLESFKKWIASGSNSSMDYLEKNFSARRHPSGVFPKARTLLVAVLSLARISQEFKPLLDEKDGIFRTGAQDRGRTAGAGGKAGGAGGKGQHGAVALAAKAQAGSICPALALFCQLCRPAVWGSGGFDRPCAAAPA